MNKQLRVRVLPLVLASLLASSPSMAQNTSASMTGRVTDAAGNAVAGAEVEIVHVPSGTTKKVTTDANGKFNAQGLRVGGPFVVDAEKSGLQKAERKDVYLKLAEDTTLDLQMASDAQSLEKIEVTASAASSVFQADNKGLSTTISQRDLKNTPAPSRSIQDIARLDPRIVITDKGDGSISAAGQNSRYNNISVDAVQVNDPFGLNANGMPYLGSPISVDTIEEYNISTANYDVSSSTVGAEINAVTKSGTNDIHGSVYYSYRNASHLVGEAGWLPKTNPGYDYKGYKTDWTAGFTIGAPLIKDTLFIFANYEETKTTALGADSANGLDFSLTGGSTSNKISQSDLNRIIAIANAKGLIPGGYGTIAGDLQDKRGLVKLDWNINDFHRASLTLRDTKEDQPIIQGNAANAVGLSSYWYNKNSETKSYTLNLYDDWNDTFSTETSLSYSPFDQVRSTDAQQPQVFINLGATSAGAPNGSPPFVDLGEDQFSHYNVLDVKTTNAFFAGTWNLTNHVVKVGGDYEQKKIYNLFGRTEFGAYTFWGIDNFEKGIYNQFDLYQPAPGYTLDDVAARWTYKQYGVFAQDTWQLTDRLSVQYGLRMDIPQTDDAPINNPAFKAAYGFQNDATISGNFLVEPRFSFNYNFDTQRLTQLRGGAGLFQSAPPTVWLTNPYQNNGMTVTTYSFRNAANAVNPCLPAFSSDPFNQHSTAADPTAPGCSAARAGQMTVDTLDPNFQLPSVAKFSLAFDRELPWFGTIFSAELEYLDTYKGILYKNLNIGSATGVLPDGRNSYYKNPLANPTGNTSRANANPAFGQAITYLTNTNQGKSTSLSLALKQVKFSDDLFGNAAATFSNATEVNPGTSSQASSNFSNDAFANPNEDVASPTNYNIKQRLNMSLTWQHHFFGDNATAITAFVDGHSGQPYSWVFGNDANGDSYSGRDLVYIPHKGDVLFTDNTAAGLARQEQFWNYIQHDPYLSKHQGEIAGRNRAVAAWINQLDMSFRQEVPGFFEGNKGEFRLDVFNFANLLNNKWGQTSYVGFPYTRTLASSAGVDPATGKYIYDLPKDANGNYQPGTKIIYDAGRDQKTNVVSRWSVMATVRYSF
jgi:hypothetical protein